MSLSKKIDGDHVLYHFLQKELLVKDSPLFENLASRLVASLGIWLPPTIYAQLPILVPYAVRDSSCRKRTDDGVEEWGCPNAGGYFRDDNSLIKNVPGTLKVKSPLEGIYNQRHIGTGFVASHVWRTTREAGILASKNPLTYSFIPNLVWLPSQVAKLTDREGSFTQRYLQALSVKIYKDVRVQPHLKNVAKRIWALLPNPTDVSVQGLPDIAEVSFFDDAPQFVQKRLSTIRHVANALSEVASGRTVREKIISSRYTQGIASLRRSDAKTLSNFLRELIGD